MVPRYSCTDWALMYEGSFYNVQDNYLQQHIYSGLCANLTIQMYGPLVKALKKPEYMPVPAASFKDGQSKDLVLFSNKIFSEQFETNIEIISATGSKHACHKIFLTGTAKYNINITVSPCTF